MEKSKTQILFGKNLKNIRKDHNMSQEELAFALNISPKHLSFIENGSSFVSANLLDKISTVLSVPVSVLFYNADNSLRNNDLTENIKNKAMISEIEKIIDNNFLTAYNQTKNEIYAIIEP